ncbi:hypothetical protein AYI69_g11212 [Smittium culicis]|uniref:Uncharacterized protein n=1 Tax=Smittium culicis TaxID=133412 RepID=A0A1R1X0E6_9FUNG|nr:hypothetical protein AYI69_g11212 [Smittium culicis]
MKLVIEYPLFLLVSTTVPDPRSEKSPMTDNKTWNMILWRISGLTSTHEGLSEDVIRLIDPNQGKTKRRTRSASISKKIFKLVSG